MPRHKSYAKGLDDFHTRLGRLAALDAEDLKLVWDLVDLIEFGDQENWILSHLRDLVCEVAINGPAEANDDCPTSVLSAQAYELSNCWHDMTNAVNLRERHPSLFAEPTVDSEPLMPKSRSEKKTTLRKQADKDSLKRA